MARDLLQKRGWMVTGITMEMNIISTVTKAMFVMILLMPSAGSSMAQQVQPFPTPPMGGKVAPTMQESVHKWREAPRHLPEDAPNILIVMLDDAGFGQPSAFGGEIQTPTSCSIFCKPAPW